MSETVNIIEFKASGRRGRLVSPPITQDFRRWGEFVNWIGANWAAYIEDRFELEPEPVKLPEDRWAVVDRYGTQSGGDYATRDEAQKMMTCVYGVEDNRVVRVRFEEEK